MKLGRPRSKTEPAYEEHPSSRRLSELPVLLALAALVAGAVSLGLLLAPRSPGDDSPEAGFTRDMMIHHTQAVQMANAVRDRTEDPEIRLLATDVILTQQAEIGQMRGWLEVWGLPANGPDPPMAWMGHPTTGLMPGMAKPQDLARLHQGSPQEADEQFLRLMIPHHQSAVVMAEAVLERSDRPEVQRLAQKTVTSQQAEIRGMQALLQRKGFSPVEDSKPSFDSEEHTSHEHTHNLAETLQDTARLGALPLAVLAVAWLILDAIRRHRARAGLADPVSPPLFWRAMAIGGLAASAILHIGLAPAHLEEATSHGVFFVAAGVALAVTAAAILAWPSRPAYIAGAGISLALIVLWAIFRIVPPPGSDVAEDVDLVGLFTKGTELVALVSCTVLWFRARRIHRSEHFVTRSNTTLYLAVVFSLVAALIHLWTMPERFEEGWGYGMFFLIAAIAQGLYGTTLLRWPRQPLFLLGIGGNLLIMIIGLYLVTRTVGISFFGPSAGGVEEVGAIALSATMSELALVIVLGALLLGRLPRNSP
jgi:uncharacterized protein (DUF305 family)